MLYIQNVKKKGVVFQVLYKNILSTQNGDKWTKNVTHSIFCTLNPNFELQGVKFVLHFPSIIGMLPKICYLALQLMKILGHPVTQSGNLVLKNRIPRAKITIGSIFGPFFFQYKTWKNVLGHPVTQNLDNNSDSAFKNYYGYSFFVHLSQFLVKTWKTAHFLDSLYVILIYINMFDVRMVRVPLSVLYMCLIFLKIC